MSVDWELRESGPVDAERSVLLLPGGMCSAGSYAEVMAEPALEGVRLVAATMPGHAGAPPPNDFTVENYARLTAELAAKLQADVIVGFSMGATVAVELVTSGAFTGPVVLLGVSLSSADEPAIFRVGMRLGSVLGGLPSALLAKVAASMVKRIPVSEQRRSELREDFRRNVPHDVQRSGRAYLDWLRNDEHRARRLCQAGVATWVVHAERGDGGLTADERTILQNCPHVHVRTIPGSVFFLPNEIPDQVAQVITEAAAAAP
jgi:pimeloyl-ACP methyl ester carboxylesterase